MSEEQVVEGTEVDEAVLNEATSQGWVSKDKFKGDEKDWVEAEVFVKRGREILPILRKNNENLLKELNHTKESLKEFKQAAEEFKKFQKDSYERKAKDFEIQIEQLKSARAQAISDGDGQRVNALDDAIDIAKEEVKSAKSSATTTEAKKFEVPATVDPELQSWMDRNSWFGKDDMLTEQANAIGNVIRKRNPNVMGVEFLKKLDEALLEEFPHKLGKSSRSPNYQAESGAGRPRPGAGGNKHSYENLPSDAKAACDKFVKQGLMKREDYLRDFEWEQ